MLSRNYQYDFILGGEIMKFKKGIAIVAGLIFLSTGIKVDANIGGNNITSSELVAQSIWYTKLIDLTGYNKKDIKGTLNFELLPSNMGNKKYYAAKDDTKTKFLEVLPGKSNFSYKVPFSSDDFVDAKFNNLAMQAADTNGNSIELFDYALLHEWGRMVSSDHGQTAGVGPLIPERWNNDFASGTYEEMKQIFDEQLAPDHYVDWEGDPVHNIIGWKSSQEFHTHNTLNDWIGSYEDGSQSLLEYPEFINGTFRYSQVFTLAANPAVSYKLKCITRPIAISKEYDADGNIKSIEKPLLPSTDFSRLMYQYKYDDQDNYIGDEYGNKILRYTLKENKAEGIDLEVENENLIVDVYPDRDTVYMFKDVESADAFYTNMLKEEEDVRWMGDEILAFGKSNKVQLKNDLSKVSVNMKKRWEDDNNKAKKRPESITVKLFADGKYTGKKMELSEDNDWQATFKNLLKSYDGKEIKYSIKEEPNNSYMTKITGDAKSGFVITNTLKSEKKVFVPKTGDSSNLLIYTGLIAVAFMGIGIGFKKKRKL